MRINRKNRDQLKGARMINIRITLAIFGAVDSDCDLPIVRRRKRLVLVIEYNSLSLLNLIPTIKINPLTGSLVCDNLLWLFCSDYNSFIFSFNILKKTSITFNKAQD